MKRCLALLALLLCLVGRPALAEVTLRSSVMVDGPVVKLGDLFDNIGNKADVAVARAPAPGRRVTVDSDWLRRVAAMNGLDWRPQTVFDQCMIERNGVTITHAQIEATILKALADQNLPAGAQVELANRSMEIVVPVDVPPDMEVRDLSYDSEYKRFNATIEAPAHSPAATRVHVSGRVVSTIEVPVLARPIGRGDIIAARDLVWTRVRQDAVRRDMLVDADHIIGLTPRHELSAGQMVGATDLQKPIVVTRGSLVTMVLQTGSMSLSAQGRAVEEGSVGDVIRVINTHSNLTVEGKITAPNIVTVSLNGVTALAN